MGRQILDGDFPIFYWRQEHAGVPEAYGAAVMFFLFGVSRLALNLVPALATLGLVLALYRTGAVLFGHGAGLLAILFAMVVAPYVIGHYVLARAYYVEQLLLGQLVLLGAALWLRRPLTEPGRDRALVAMGLAGGMGLYCNFQIAYALVPATLALLLVDPGLVRRRGAWLGLGAFLLGSAPFWIYNLIHGWATFATGARFAGGLSTGEAAQVIAAELLPVALGMADGDLRPYLPWPWPLLIPAIVLGAAGLLSVRVARGAKRLRQDPALAGEALLLAAAAVAVGVVLFGGYVRVARYLLPLAPVLALILARACQLVWQRSRPLAVVATALYVTVVGYGLVGDIGALWPGSRAAYRAARTEDERLFQFLRTQGLTRAYAYDYWLAPRLTFDARREIIVAQPFSDRYPPYTRAVDASPRPAYVFRGGSSRLANWLGAIQAHAGREEIGRYTVFWDFTAPPRAVPLPRATWTVRASPGLGEPGRLVDARLATGWTSAEGPPGSAWLGVDLGRVRTTVGLALIAEQPGRLPRTLEVTAEDGRGPARPVVRIDTAGFTLTWRNGAPRMEPGLTLTVRFPPTEARRLKLTDLGPGGRWSAAELFVLGPGDGATATPQALEEGRRLEKAGALRSALLRYRDATRAAPDDPDGYTELARLAAQTGPGAASPGERAAFYARLGLVDEARAVYARLTTELGPGLTHVELTERRARLATAAGDSEEAQRLRSEAEAALTPPRRVEAVFGRRVELRGYELSRAAARPGETLDLVAYWRLLEPTAGPLVAQVEFKGGHRHFGGEQSLPAPLAGLGDGPQRVAQRQGIVVPADAAPGPYRIVLGVRDPTSGQRLRLWKRGLLPTTTHVVELGVLEVHSRGLGGPAEAKGASAGDRRVVVLAAGDSITAASYPGYLQGLFDAARLEVTVVNAGVNGHTSGEYLAYLRSRNLLARTNPDVILLQLGTNDVRIDGDHTETARYRRQMSEILDRMLSHRNPRGTRAAVFLATIPPVVVTVPGRFDASSRERVTAEINPAIRRLARERGLRLVETYELFVRHPEWLPEIHPNEDGYRAMARQWFEVLAPHVRRTGE